MPKYFVEPPRERMPRVDTLDELPGFIARRLKSKTNPEGMYTHHYVHFMNDMVKWANDEYQAALNYFVMTNNVEVVRRLKDSSPCAMLLSHPDFLDQLNLLTVETWQMIPARHHSCITDAFELAKKLGKIR